MKCDHVVCNSVRAVFVGCTVHTFPVGWLEVLSKEPKPVLTLKKNRHLPGLEEC